MVSETLYRRCTSDSVSELTNWQALDNINSIMVVFRVTTNGTLLTQKFQIGIGHVHA